MMEHNQDEKSISLADLWQVFVRHFWIIIATALVAFTALFAYQMLTYSPRYTSSATIYLLKNEDDSPSSADFSLALNTVNDCQLTLRSHYVLDRVIDDLAMPISYETLVSMISIDNPDSSRFIQVSVTASNPSDAKVIVDTLCNVGRDAIIKLMGINQVNLVDSGTYSTTPSNSKITVLPFVGGIAAAALVYAVFVIIVMIDGRIISSENVESAVGLPVLGTIPFAGTHSKDKYGAYGRNGYYGKYGYGHQSQNSSAKAPRNEETR